MTRVVVVAFVLVGAGTAHADRRETSVHAHLVGGMATVGDQDASESASAPLGGLAVRASYATSNSYQYDVSLSLLATGGASFPSVTFMPPGHPAVTGPYSISSQVTRLDGGVTLRLGVAWIPTVRLAIGGQARRSGGPVVTNGSGEVSGEDQLGRGSDLGFDLVGTGTIGLDHRINRRLIVGAAAGASMAVPLGGDAFRTIEVTAHAAYYWYPR
jgi:hypothetical protein